MKIIDNISDLRILEKQGIVEFHSHTGKKVSTPFGAIVTALYVEKVNPNKKGYYEQYVDGSFYPYVGVR